jgi:hypothetical protein
MFFDAIRHEMAMRKLYHQLQEEEAVAQLVADVFANILTHEVSQFVSILKRWKKMDSKYKIMENGKLVER